MEQFIPVEIFRKKAFPALPWRPKFSLPLVGINRVRLPLSEGDTHFFLAVFSRLKSYSTFFGQSWENFRRWKKKKKIIHTANNFLLTEFFANQTKCCVAQDCAKIGFNGGTCSCTIASHELRKNWSPGGYSLVIALWVYVAPKGMVFVPFWS